MAAEPADMGMALAERLATRICHDLAGLCGTLVGTLELAVEDTDSLAEALPLAHDVAAVLAARLRLLRAAWGPPSEPMDANALMQLSLGLPGVPKLRVDLSEMPPDETLPPELARIVLNALLLGAEALPGGGTVTLARQGSPGAGGSLVVSIAGRRAGWPAVLPGLLQAPHDAATMLRDSEARGLQAPLLVLLARLSGMTLHLQAAPDGAAPALRIASATGTA